MLGDDTLLGREEASQVLAQHLGVFLSPATLAQLTHKRQGIPFVRGDHQRVLMRWADIRAWAIARQGRKRALPRRYF